MCFLFSEVKKFYLIIRQEFDDLWQFLKVIVLVNRSIFYSGKYTTRRFTACRLRLDNWVGLVTLFISNQKVAPLFSEKKKRFAKEVTFPSRCVPKKESHSIVLFTNLHYHLVKNKNIYKQKHHSIQFTLLALYYSLLFTSTYC